MSFPFKPVGKKIILTLADPKKDCMLGFQFHRAHPFEVIAVADDVSCVKVGDIVYCDKERCQSMSYLRTYYNIVEENQIMMKRTDDYESLIDDFYYESGPGVYGELKIGGT